MIASQAYLKEWCEKWSSGTALVRQSEVMSSLKFSGRFGGIARGRGMDAAARDAPVSASSSFSLDLCVCSPVTATSILTSSECVTMR
jgi:hypothetical protein